MFDFRPVFDDLDAARTLHYARVMRRWASRATLSFAILLPLFVGAGSARLEGADEATLLDTTAVRELLHGPSGVREVWTEVPSLVVLTSVMQYTGTGDMSSGYVATGEQLSDAEVAQLTADLTQALATLTGGTVGRFANVRHESVAPGQATRVLRRGQIVVGRFRDVNATEQRVGYSGRTARGDGSITAAAVILDRDFDRDSTQRALLRTHELGHALGYNHVDSRVSVMNRRVGSEITDFDRAAIQLAYAESAE